MPGGSRSDVGLVGHAHLVSSLCRSDVGIVGHARKLAVASADSCGTKGVREQLLNDADSS